MKSSSTLFLAAALCVAPAVLRAADAHHKSSWESVSHAVAVLHPTEGSKTKGVVTFTQMGGKVKIVAKLEGLTPNQAHAFHIHEFGDVTSADGTSTGGHYNPEKHDHGLPDSGKRHAGDLGNVKADASGKATYEITVDNISIAGLKNPIIGRGVIVHAKPDDGGQPTGNAGARICSGVIGIGKSAH